ncbi:MAG TPA: hypothetical protein ENH11_10325 [Candidatus Acetothermia bacterium]|nr:hypothetical protein [Candidatus Acetothermia bacterium]
MFFGDISLTTLVGLVAGALTTSAFLPQALKAWRTRSTHDLSLSTFVMLTAGIVLWLAYGLLLQDPPLVIANAITLVFAAAILWIKARHG